MPFPAGAVAQHLEEAFAHLPRNLRAVPGTFHRSGVSACANVRKAALGALLRVNATVLNCLVQRFIGALNRPEFAVFVQANGAAFSSQKVCWTFRSRLASRNCWILFARALSLLS